MAYTKYSLTPANNNAAPPDGAPEGMLPSAVNDTMRDMMAQIRDCGDGIRGGTYTMTAPVITGGSISGASVSATSLTDSGNLTFTGTGNRILGDFSNATQSNRVYFQTSTTNGITTLPLISNGTATQSGFLANNASDPTNSGYLASICNATEGSIRVAYSGTGSFLPLTMYTGGSERLRIDSSGNVGIGTTSPSGKLHVNGQTYIQGSVSGGLANSTLIGNSSGQAQFWGLGADTSTTGSMTFVVARSNLTNSNQALTIDSSGNVGVGTTAPLRTLMVEKSAGAVGFGAPYAQIGGGNFAAGGYYTIGFGYTAASYTNPPAEIGYVATSSSGGSLGDLVFATRPVTTNTAPTERMRIDSNGNLLVGTTVATLNAGAGIKITPAGDGANLPRMAFVSAASTDANLPISMYSTGAAAYRFYVGMSGTIYATNTTISSLSDARFKENVRDLDDGLNVVMQLKPRKFDWKEGKGADKKNVRGFIAQEFETVFPDLIDEWKDPAPKGEEPYKSVRQDLIPVLVKAIQEQQVMIEELNAKVAALEAA